MVDSKLADFSSQVVRNYSDTELDQRLGLYRVFLKLYEHHRGLLDEILDLENTDNQWRSRVVLRYVQGNIRGQHVHLTSNLLKGKTRALYQAQGIWVIGRDRKAALPIQDKRLSRRHAAIQHVEDEGFYLIDLNSTNGSFINGEPVRHCALLNDGDQVRLGSLAFTFFASRVSKSLENVPTEVLNQINANRNEIAALHKNSISANSIYSTATVDWDSSLATGVEETSMFRVSPAPIPGDERSPASLITQLNSSQQADILDRFLKR